MVFNANAIAKHIRLIKQHDGNFRWRRESARNSLDFILIVSYLGIRTAPSVVK